MDCTGAHKNHPLFPRVKRREKVGCIDLCMPGMGVNLWGDLSASGGKSPIRELC
ncbi:MAG: hypothetical protein K8R07_01055 [Desulfobacterales bacterium]|nr:hypothetical protein [Desulfobacterales bacterium]